jgi:hypothetical protein
MSRVKFAVAEMYERIKARREPQSNYRAFGEDEMIKLQWIFREKARKFRGK